ncbi:radical SAM protein [Pseudomonas sp. 5P_5.1_Bac1]|uniref:radical SAM protein n=1 Tax=Pseudomonas sp. 5P_5.1_Bac1 TaxID=2971616 RepID=UPI0021C71607|nr:radical SAM protein [Pseudomonas sp. 5P_5.1_Bac1]MCU1724149.1 radical SAM protein [Pseudomonas sp. 5P_5.1_Bac1]
MDLQGHLLYIDITQICGIGCAFCMYADKHKSGMSMELSSLARENLAALINAADVKRISISGEGEPLNNAKVFHEILGLSHGGKQFEFITSGFFPHDKMAAFYDTTQQLVTARGDHCNIRLSADSHHIEKVKWRAHGFSLDYQRRQGLDGLSFSFRSIDTDRAFTRGYLLEELARWDIQAAIEPRSALEDVLVVGESRFGIDYKNLVHPAADTPAGYLDLHGYIGAIEAKINKRFTLGSLNPPPAANGMDLTIKPNGDVYLYGIEHQRLGNIHFDRIRWEHLASHVRETPLVRALYSQPLADLLARVDKPDLLRSILAKANNPYWLVKEMANHDGLLEQLVPA